MTSPHRRAAVRADARLPAAGRSGLRRTGARPGVRGRRLWVLLDKRRADTRYLKRLRSVSAASEMAGRPASGGRSRSHRPRLAAARLVRRQLRGYRRCCAIAPIAGGAAGSASRHVGAGVGAGDAADGGAAAGPDEVQRVYCRLVLRCFGVRITVSAARFETCAVSWWSAAYLLVGRLLHRFGVAGSFVARADMFTGGAIGVVARILKIIPIERASLRRLPAVVDVVARRLRSGQTVVAFPEGTTWCGWHGEPGHTQKGSGSFYPAMFQADRAARPVQPLRRAITTSTAACPPLRRSSATTRCSVVGRLLTVRRTVARVHVESLQLPGTNRRDLARRCQSAVRVAAPAHPGHGHALVA